MSTDTDRHAVAGDESRPADDSTVRATGSPRRLLPVAVPVGVLALLVYLPYVPLDVPWLLPDRVNGPGSMQLLALCLVFGGIALSYDVLFGRTGLLSFGHALFVATGAYGTAVAIEHWGIGLAQAAVVALGLGLALALVVGAVALRVSGIAFAMVTLAFAQAAAIAVQRNPGGLTGGEEGLPLDRSGVPDLLVGVLNAPYRYWLALAYLVVCWLLVSWLGRSRAGHVWAAVRENPERVAVLGLSTYRARLGAFVVGCLLGCLGGIVHLVVTGGVTVHTASSELTLTLLVMVVLGGAGSRWGPVFGGVLYTYLDNRLLGLASSDVVQGLPAVLRVPASQPLFVLGAVFVVVVFFAPGGLTGVLRGRGGGAPQAETERDR